MADYEKEKKEEHDSGSLSGVVVSDAQWSWRLSGAAILPADLPDREAEPTHTLGRLVT